MKQKQVLTKPDFKGIDYGSLCKPDIIKSNIINNIFKLECKVLICQEEQSFCKLILHEEYCFYLFV